MVATEEVIEPVIGRALGLRATELHCLTDSALTGH